MSLKPVVLLGLLPHLIVAGVTCNYSSAAQKGDTCQSFADSWDLSVGDIKSLNPGLECPDLSPGQEICVIGSASSDGPATTSKPARLTTTSHAPVKPKTTTLQKQPAPTNTGDRPSPTQTGLISSCDKYHLVSSGDQCAAIEKTYGITSDEFNKWNPAINDKCTNLWLGYYVCVHATGAVEATSVIQPSASITTSKATPTSSEPEPQAPGIVSNCKKFYKVKTGESCWSISNSAGVTIDQIRSWNKDLDSGCSNLWTGYYICIGV